MATFGALSLYECSIPGEQPLLSDVPLSLVFPGEIESFEGLALTYQPPTLLWQTYEPLGPTLGPVTLIPDTAGFFDTAAQRLRDMAVKSEAFPLGPAERLVPLLTADPALREQAAGAAVVSTAFTTVWEGELNARRARLAALAVELVRADKRILLVSPSHRDADDLLGTIVRGLRMVGLPYKSLATRYDTVTDLATHADLFDLGFEAQVHRFCSRAQSDRATLRRKYERFRELTPLLAMKAEKQRDLDEVKLLEWRLLGQLGDWQGKIRETNATLDEYDSIPIWKRLALQTVGKNVQTLREYLALYEQQMQGVLKELEVAKGRIDALSPEAALPKELRPEYQELKEEIVRLGGTKRIRELIAAEEGTNPQGFLQNKRIVATTASRVATDPLFVRMRFDVLLADEAPLTPAPFLLAAAGLVQERIVLSGDLRDFTAEQKESATENAEVPRSA